MSPASAPSARQVEGFVILTLTFRKEGRLWLGQCLELGTATDGRSLDQVHDELSELVTLHLDTLEDVGERERFFTEHGIKFYTEELPPRQLTLPFDEEAFFHPQRFPVAAPV